MAKTTQSRILYHFDRADGPFARYYFDTDHPVMRSFHYPVNDPDSDLERSRPPRGKFDDRYRYAYDPFTIWGRKDRRCNATDYTDRLQQQDYQKFSRIFYRLNSPDSNGTYPNMFSDRACRGDLVQKLLQEYYDNPGIILLRVIEYCNWSTGYNTFRLDYFIPPT